MQIEGDFGFESQFWQLLSGVCMAVTKIERQSGVPVTKQRKGPYEMPLGQKRHER